MQIKLLPILIPLIALLTAGCAPTAVVTPAASQTKPPAAATATPAATVATSTPYLSPTPPPPSPTPGCSESGSIESNLVTDKGFGRDLPYTIYLPPCYSAIDGSLPTLYLLHGLGGDDQQWLQLGAAEAADALIQAGEIPPFLMVFPWQRTGLDDEIAIIQGLLPHVEANYAALPAGSWRAIGGLSRGGGWALRLGLKHPVDFYRVGLHSPAPRSGDLTAMEVWRDQQVGARRQSIWIDVGDEDSLLPAAQQIADRLEALNYDFVFSVRSGDHQAEYWQENLEDYLRWYSARW